MLACAVSCDEAAFAAVPWPLVDAVSLSGRILEEGLRGGGQPQRLQQQAVGGLWPLATLQWEHVLLPCGAGHFCPQAHELPRTLVGVTASLMLTFSCSMTTFLQRVKIVVFTFWKPKFASSITRKCAVLMGTFACNPICDATLPFPIASCSATGRGRGGSSHWGWPTSASCTATSCRGRWPAWPGYGGSNRTMLTSSAPWSR